MKLFTRLFIVGLLSGAPLYATNDDYLYDGIEFDMPRVFVPSFPDYSVSIADFGAVGDGKTLNTKAIARAIKAASKKGGGRVVIPRGIWLTGPILLKDNIDLHAEAGALVIFSADKDLYPIIETSFEGLDTMRCTSPIYGKGLTNIAITGEGIFDGSGEVWRKVKKEKMTEKQWKDLLQLGGSLDPKGTTWYPSEQYMLAAQKSGNIPTYMSSREEFESVRDLLRPVMVSLVDCKNILLDGPVFQNSPAWCIHPLMCENLTVRNIDVRNPWYSQNGDGIDIESCKNAIVTNCRFDVGDDAICIKSGRDEDGRNRGIPTENLIVKNCIVYHAHGGFTVGSEMSGGVKNMHVSDCTFIGTDVGIRFKSTRGRGGIVEDIYISNIDMTNIKTRAISFNLYYGGLSVSEMMSESKRLDTDTVFPVSEKTPQFKDIHIRDVNCIGTQQAIYLQGLPEMSLKNVNLRNMNFKCESGLLAMDADGITIKDVSMVASESPAITLYNTQNVKMSNLALSGSDGELLSIKGSQSNHIDIVIASQSSIKKRYTIGSEVETKGIKIRRK